MKLKNLTLEKYKCLVGACPAIYEITPEKYRCGIGVCPGIYDGLSDDYLIIGEQIEPKSVGLEKKVGAGEVLIRIKKEIIDEKKD